MRKVTRRHFAVSSLAGVSCAIAPSARALDSLACGVSKLAVPRRLLPVCASAANLRLFRQNSEAMGLAGVVNVTNAGGAFDVGSLFLYPWLKKAGQPLRRSARAALPFSTYQAAQAELIPNADLPQDEYFCRHLLDLPWQCFIGFTLDVPASDKSKASWRTNDVELADGGAISIEWVSSNLNRAWFGGAVIPEGDCGGGAWRTLILNALNTTSRLAC